MPLVVEQSQPSCVPPQPCIAYAHIPMRHAILAPRPTLTSSRCQATLDVTTETISAGRGAIDAVIQVSTEEGVQGDVAVCTVEAVASSPLRTAGPGRTITQPGVDVNPSPSERWGGDGSDGEATVLDVEVSSEEEPATRGQPAALADALLTYLEVRPPPLLRLAPSRLSPPASLQSLVHRTSGCGGTLVWPCYGCCGGGGGCISPVVQPHTP